MKTGDDVVTVVVDDNEIDRYLVRRYLAKREQFGGFIEASTGIEFLEEVCDGQKLNELSEKPILVLMDINMPMIDGFETAKRLQERVENGDVPASIVVMMFTSSENPEDRKRAESIDIVKGYIVKPMDDDDLSYLLTLYDDL